MTENSRFVANPDFLCREIAGEYMLIYVGTRDEHGYNNQLMSFNDTGYFIWSQLQNPLSLQELCAKAQEKFMDPKGTLTQEIVDFVHLLNEKGILIIKE